MKTRRYKNYWFRKATWQPGELVMMIQTSGVLTYEHNVPKVVSGYTGDTYELWRGRGYRRVRR